MGEVRPFVADVKEIRRRARQHLTAGAVTKNYGGNVKEAVALLIKENLVAERIAIETYREMMRYLGEKDPTTRVLLERILAQEEEHANDMHDLLVAHQGQPMLDG